MYVLRVGSFRVLCCMTHDGSPLPMGGKRGLAFCFLGHWAVIVWSLLAVCEWTHLTFTPSNHCDMPPGKLQLTFCRSKAHKKQLVYTSINQGGLWVRLSSMQIKVACPETFLGFLPAVRADVFRSLYTVTLGDIFILSSKKYVGFTQTSHVWAHKESDLKASKGKDRLFNAGQRLGKMILWRQFILTTMIHNHGAKRGLSLVCFLLLYKKAIEFFNCTHLLPSLQFSIPTRLSPIQAGDENQTTAPTMI